MRSLINKCALFLFTVLACSCVNDDLPFKAPYINEAVLSFTLPHQSKVEVGAQSKTAKDEFEKKISNMNIFVVEATQGEDTNPADDAEVLAHYNKFNNTGDEITVSITTTNKPCWVVAIVNMNDNTVVPTTYRDIKDLSVGLSSLYASAEAAGESYANELPMFGQKYYSTINTGNDILELKHLCARLDVKSTAPSYMLESVTLMNGAKKGYFVPRSPMAKYAGTDVIQYETTTKGEGELAIPSIYFFENGGGEADAKNYTDIILGGTYTVSAGNDVASYIKVKLEYGEQLSADVLRNTLYNLTLISVDKSNVGYSSIDDAMAGEYSDVELDIEVGTEALADLVVGNGDYYMSLSNSEYRAYIPSGTKQGLTAVTLRYNKNSASSVDMKKVKKEITLGADSKGIKIVGSAGDKTDTWNANEDIAIKVDLSDGAQGSLIVRIGNLVKEIKVVRQSNTDMLSTDFNDDNYVFAKFTGQAPVWLPISTKNATPSVNNELYSEDGFKLGFNRERDDYQSAELFLSRSSVKGRTKVYVEQYKAAYPYFRVYGLQGNMTNISYLGEVLSSKFRVTSDPGDITFLDGFIISDASWVTEFSVDGGTTWNTEKPDWIKIPVGGEGSIYEDEIFEVSSQLLLPDISLANRPVKGTPESPYNLANATGSTEIENTANCYIIESSGTYKIPMIYGNGIKNGMFNYSAFDVEAFVKHDGAAFTKPQIDGVTNAILCWQDLPGLVKDVTFENGYLVFTVPKESINEGNAVLAVRNASNQILWSWHIWVTNYSINEDKTVYYDSRYSPPYGQTERLSRMMNVNLGWCSPGLKTYGNADRSVRIRFKQVGGNLIPSTNGYEFTQLHGSVITSGNNPYYQYGRKDPMLPSIGAGNVDKYQSGSLMWAIEGDQVSTEMIIQNPNVFYTGVIPFQPLYANPWSVRVSGYGQHIANHIKSVYDPCPLGYIVPPISYFSRFTIANVSDAFDNGWNFYCGPNNQGETIFLPATGYRMNDDGTLSGVGTGANYVTASQRTFTNSWQLKFDSYDIQPEIDILNSFMNNVRPVRE